MKYFIFLLFAFSFSASDFLPFHSNAICYGPFRDGQGPGVSNPTREEIKQDLIIMAKHWSVIRMYGARGSTEIVLDVIKKEKINLKLYLGAWIADERKDSTSKLSNIDEINKTIELSNEYPNIVEAIIIGNETQVFWTSNKVDYSTLRKYIHKVKSKTNQPITTADDFNFWNKPEGISLAKELDFLMLHIHPLWAGTQLEGAVPFVSKIYDEIADLNPKIKIIIGETGWATKVHDKGEQAKLIKGSAGINEQLMFYKDISKWSLENNVTTFFFEAFDEKWKGGEHPNEVEKHWGLFYSNRIPKHTQFK